VKVHDPALSVLARFEGKALSSPDINPVLLRILPEARSRSSDREIDAYLGFQVSGAHSSR